MSGDIKPTSDATRSVYGTRGSSKSQGSQGAAGSRQGGAAGAADGSARSDTVDLTSRAQRFMELESQLAATPVVDSARVSEIRESLADGSYQIDAEAIADKMLEVARQAGRRGV